MRVRNIAAIVLVLSLTAQLSLGQSGKRILVTEFGAVADGTTMNTQAIQKAIDAAAAGGGTVVIPKGTFLSGSIFLKAGVHLEIEKDGVLKGTTDTAHYPKQNTRIEGHFEPWLPALVNIDKSDGVRISGEGTLDGSGQPFWTSFYDSRAANPAHKNLDTPRPRLMYIANSKDVQVKGLRFKDSAFWNLHIYNCQQVLIENLDIRAGERSPSTDGIDIDSSQYVTIKGCYIFNNDDTIALKGTKGPLADKDTSSPAVEHIRISDCTFARGGAFVTCGSEATVVRDVIVENCKSVDPGPTTLLRLKMRTDTPQHYEDIHFRNIEIGTASTLIGVAPWSQYFDLMGQPQPTRIAKNITYTNIKGNVRTIGGIAGGPGDVFEDFKFENVDIQVSGGAAANWWPIKGMSIKNFKVNGQEWAGPTIVDPNAAPRGGRGGAGGPAGGRGARGGAGPAAPGAPAAPAN